MKLVKPTILLTFDVEEFDIPLEYKQPIQPDLQMEIGKNGLDIITEILNKQGITCTLFTTGSFAKTFPDSLKSLAQKHEIASHSLYHSTFQKSDLLNARILLQNITGQTIEGFRMPRMKPINIDWLKEAGYSYDASINPTYMPGRYNNLNLSRKIYLEKNFPRLPCSVSPNLRIPLFWLSFKNFPYTVYKKLAMQTLKQDGYLSLYFHPWEFTDISKFNLPFYVKRFSGNQLQQKLNKLITDLKSVGSFNTVSSLMNVHTY